MLVQHDGFVVAIHQRFRLHERGVDVRAGDLAARRDGVVVDAPPGGHADICALFLVDIAAKGCGENCYLVGHAVQLHADAQVGLVCQRANVGILAEPLTAQQLKYRGAQLLGAVAHVHEQQPRRGQETSDVFLQAEDVQLLLLLVPIRPDAAETSRAVVHRVRHHAHLGLVNRYNLAFKKRVLGLHVVLALAVRCSVIGKQ